MNDIDSAKALMTLFLNLDYEQRADFIYEIEMLKSPFMKTTLAHHFKPIHDVIAQGGEDEDDRHMGIYALGHYDNDQRKVLDVKYDSFADYYIDNDGNDCFDQMLLTLCECRAGLYRAERYERNNR